MFLARPRHYGLAAVAGVSAVVSAIIANELAIAVYFVVKRLPIGVRLFTGYFTNPRAIFWISNVIMIVVAAGLTALRVSRVRAGEARATGMPPQPWGPPGQQWGPQPSYGPPQHGPQGPYGPPPGHPGPYGPPQPTQPPQPPQPPQQAPDRPASEPLG
jgi:hypothetical protein